MTTGLMIEIGLAAGLGACSRLGLTDLVNQRPYRWPIATFMINVLGAFLLAYVAGHLVNFAWQKIVMVGFLGGFTTFSTFNNEVVTLWTAGHRRLSAGYLVATLLLGIIAAGLGFIV